MAPQSSQMTSKPDPVTLDEVRNARSALIKQGKKPTHVAVRAELGNRGSFSTIGRFLGEIETEENKTSESPKAKETLNAIWAQANAAAEEAFREKLALSDERNAELHDEIVRLEQELANANDDLTEARKQNAETSETLRKTVTDLQEARSGKDMAISGRLEAQALAKDASILAADAKGVLAGIVDALNADSSADTIASLTKEISTFLSRLEGIRPGEESRAIFRQLLEVDHARKEYQRIRTELEAEIARTERDNATLREDIAQLKTKLAVGEESRANFKREISEKDDRLETLSSDLKSAHGQVSSLHSLLNAAQEKLAANEEKSAARIDALHDQLRAAEVRAVTAEAKLVTDSKQ